MSYRLDELNLKKSAFIKKNLNYQQAIAITLITKKFFVCFQTINQAQFFCIVNQLRKKEEFTLMINTLFI